MRTYNDLVRWVEENTELADVDGALAWFACFQMADCGWSTKDVAHLFYDGITPHKDDPKKHIGQFLRDHYECHSEEDGYATEELIKTLKEHFGVD